MAIAEEGIQLLSVTKNGFGKRSDLADYRLIHRGGKGVITIITNDRNGPVVVVRAVRDDNDIIATSKGGMIIRIPANQISLQGRNTMGSRIMRLKPNDRVMAVSKLVSEREADEVADQEVEESVEKPSGDNTATPIKKAGKTSSENDKESSSDDNEETSSDGDEE